MIQVKPEQEKEELLKLGEIECLEFFELNNIKFPRFDFEWDKRFNKYQSYYGLYRKNKIYVNVNKTKRCVLNPVRSWSYTGYKADLTTAGVLAHECGHHLDCFLGYISNKWYKQCRFEYCVSSYEPNPSESFAESCRLLILNPNLLKTGRPKRYSSFLNFGIKPIHNYDWEKVLKYSHPKFFSAAKSWIKKGN